MDIEKKAMVEYIAAKFSAEGDFSFVDENRFLEILSGIAELDIQYMNKLESGSNGETMIYDEDEALELFKSFVSENYPDLSSYAMRLSEDYMDFAEEYLVSVDAIDWE